ARYRSELDQEKLERRALQEELELRTQLNTRLEASLSAFENARTSFQSTEQELAGQLADKAKLLKDTERALEEEMAKNQRLDLAFAATSRELHLHQQNSQFEQSKLETALHTAQLEKSRLEEESLRSRAEALSLARELRASYADFRKEVVDLVQNLSRSTSS